MKILAPIDELKDIISKEYADSKFLSALSVNGDNLQYTLNGVDKLLTVPYASYALYATNARITNTEPTSGTTYYPTFVAGLTANTNYPLRGNDTIAYRLLEGTADTYGVAGLWLGNSTASGTAGNAYGYLRLYGTNTGYTDLKAKSQTSNYTTYLPSATGTLVYHTTGTAIGSTTAPVYVDSTGKVTACGDTLDVLARGITSTVLTTFNLSYTDYIANYVAKNKLSVLIYNSDSESESVKGGSTVLNVGDNIYRMFRLIGNKTGDLSWQTCNNTGDGWNVMRTILDSSNYATTLNDTYVKKAGDTMTGQLGFSGTTYPHIYGNSNFLILSGGNFTSKSVIVEDNGFRSYGDNVMPLGISGNRWSNIYSVLGNFSGQITSSVATGTAPFVVASTTEVANLHSATATKLHTARTIWGQSFDGSANVSGNLTSVGNINSNIESSTDWTFSKLSEPIFRVASAGLVISPYDKSSGFIALRTGVNSDTSGTKEIRLISSGDVGIGTNSPSYKLHVNGTLGVTGASTLTGVVYTGNSLYTHGKTSPTDGKAGISLAGGFIGITGATPYINFYFGNSTSSTNRIIEGLSGQLTVTGKLRVGLSYTTSTDYNFHVAGTAYASTSLTTPTANITTANITTLKIGDATITWDSTNGALKVDKSLYSEEGVSALGIGVSEDGSATFDIIDNLTSTDTNAALSANQGRVLNNSIASLATTVVSQNNRITTLEEGQPLLQNAIDSNSTAITALQESTFKSTTDANGITLTWFTSAGGSTDRTVTIPSWTGNGLDDYDGTLCLIDEYFVDDIKSYITANAGSTVTVVNNLTSTSTTSALSAYQGKVLNDKFASYLTTTSASSTYMPKAGGEFSGNVSLYESDIYGSENDYEYWRITYLGAATFASVNGYTLGAACAKGVTDSSSASAISTGTNLVTERDVYYGLPKINNSHAYTSSTSIYAPTAGGTTGYYLKGNGTTSAPVWQAYSTTPTEGSTTLITSGAVYTALQNISTGSVVSFSGSLSSGTKIGTITIDGTSTDLYCETNTDTTYTLSSITGTLAVSKGGTGKTSLTSGSALIGNGTSAVSLRAITNNTTAIAVTASTNLITANTLYYHKGNSNITTVGTISSGTWNGTSIGLAYGGTGATTASAARTNLGLGTAATYSATTSVTSGSSSLVTSGAVYTALANQKVTVSQSLTSGTAIGTISVGSSTTTLYAPTATTGTSVTVVDNLTSTSTTSALSAYQGKVLNDKFASYLTTSAASSTYMCKLGGDFTGDVCLSDSDIYGSENDYEYWRITYLGEATFTKVVFNSNAYITAAATTGNMTVRGGNVIKFQVGAAADTYVMNSSGFLPATTNRYNLGGNTYKWKDLYMSGYANIDGGGHMRGYYTYYDAYLTGTYDDDSGDELWSIYSNGSAYFSGVTDGSDMTRKNVISDYVLSLDSIVNAPCFTFTWIKDKDQNNVHVGTSAQYWQNVVPEIVHGEEGKNLGLEYSTLGVLMGISLAKEIVDLKTRIEELENKLKEYEINK